jgi:hypothetical protein
MGKFMASQQVVLLCNGEFFKIASTRAAIKPARIVVLWVIVYRPGKSQPFNVF